MPGVGDRARIWRESIVARIIIIYIIHISSTLHWYHRVRCDNESGANGEGEWEYAEEEWGRRDTNVTIRRHCSASQLGCTVSERQTFRSMYRQRFEEPKKLRDLRVISVSRYIVNANVSWTLQFTSSGWEATWYQFEKSVICVRIKCKSQCRKEKILRKIRLNKHY